MLITQKDKRNKKLAYDLWEAMKDIILTENDKLENDFYFKGRLLFEKGTDKYDTWSYVDKLYPICIIQGLEREG